MFYNIFFKSQCSIFCFAADPKNPFLWAVEGNCALSHPQHFKRQYLSTTIIRPFDKALPLIFGDIEQNPGHVSFDRYQKTSTTLFPSTLTSSSSYHSKDETINTTFNSARSSRSVTSSNESSPEIKVKLPSNKSTRHSPYQLRSARQLEYQAPVGSHSCVSTLSTISHSLSVATKSGSIQDCCFSHLHNQAQC